VTKQPYTCSLPVLHAMASFTNHPGVGRNLSTDGPFQLLGK